jgi:hypothetical protein
MNQYIDQQPAMRMNTQGGHTSLHKAVMMLAVMDQELIFPCADNRWRVRKDIDDRVDSQRALIDLHGKSILFPEQKQFAPKQQALEWREQRLEAM